MPLDPQFNYTERTYESYSAYPKVSFPGFACTSWVEDGEFAGNCFPEGDKGETDCRKLLDVSKIWDDMTLAEVSMMKACQGAFSGTGKIG